MNPITKRYDFILAFDVVNGNPNGDPDAGNAPRIDPETGKGLVSDVCLKRKIRNYVTLVKRDPATGAPEAGYDIYVKEKAILNRQHKLAYDALALDSKKAEDTDKARQWMCQTFFDIRMFGAVMSTEVNCGQVRGPVQMTFARSVDRIAVLDQSITRMAVTTERESTAQSGGNRTMGRKTIVPYGLYVGYGFISPYLANDTGFSEDDLNLLWQALANMFELDRSAARGLMATRKLFVFEHTSPLGDAPAYALFKFFEPKQRNDIPVPRSFEDYTDLNIDELAVKKQFPNVSLREIV
ncbi:MAG: type I-C CRISPR-associated protein Cas7/Csd2 [Synergistaceae bacterium]|jgi:CRISPR-associated protein Csd2|nr:type I-C CRISPR-associated protein Cas7/Csd2 [Synergistaceae bacterium]